MRAHEHEHDRPVVPRPKPAHPYARDAAAAARTAAAGRRDVMSADAPTGILGLDHVLKLQRQIGNRGVVRLLSESFTDTGPSRRALLSGMVAARGTTLHASPSTSRRGPGTPQRFPVIQRVPMSELREGSAVKTVDETLVVHGYWIAGRTSGEVVKLLPPQVRVRLKSGEYKGATVPLDPERLDHALPIERAAAQKLVDDDKALNQSVATEIKASLSTPEKINQGQFNFCGPNDFLMAIALKDPVAYVKYVLEVHSAERELQTKGSLPSGRTAKLGQMSVAMDPKVLGAQSALFYRDPGAAGISQTDWMSMASLRKQATATAPAPSVTPDVQAILSAFLTGGGASAALAVMKNPADLETAIMVLKKQFEGTSGQTLEEMAVAPQAHQGPLEILRKIAEGTSPDEVAQWMTKYGATDITKAAAYDQGRTTQDLQAANNDLAAEKSVMLQIDAPAGLQGSHQTVTFDPTHGHWVLMKTPFTASNATDPEWSCQVYSWGAVHTLTIVESRIKYAYYGRVSAMIATP